MACLNLCLLRSPKACLLIPSLWDLFPWHFQGFTQLFLSLFCEAPLLVSYADDWRVLHLGFDTRQNLLNFVEFGVYAWFKCCQLFLSSHYSSQLGISLDLLQTKAALLVALQVLLPSFNEGSSLVRCLRLTRLRNFNERDDALHRFFVSSKSVFSNLI